MNIYLCRMSDTRLLTRFYLHHSSIQVHTKPSITHHKFLHLSHLLLHCSSQKTLDSSSQLAAPKLSPNRQWRLVMQGDGNLVIYNVATGKYKWSTCTGCSGATRAVMQQDGLLCLYSDAGELKWNSYTRDAGSVLRLKDDGVLAIVNKIGWTVWNSVVGWYPPQ